MTDFLKRHLKAVMVVLAVITIFGILAYWQRTRILMNSTETKLPNGPRNQEAAESDFYTEQLTEKEKEVYSQMADRLENLEGGVLTFAKPLTGEEYLRITTALENEGGDYFYGFYNIPMTEDDIYVKYEQSDLLSVKEPVISKAILFLSCARGLDEAGTYDDDGRVTNLKEIEKELRVNDDVKTAQIEETKAQTEKILETIIEEMPKEYGEKQAVDYFLQWMEDNLNFASDVGEKALSFSSMQEVFDEVYVHNNLSCVIEGKATAVGYAKVLSELCKRAGMESHIVLGVWGRTKTEGYVFTLVKFGEDNIYVDASGGKGTELAEQKYLSEREAMNHMSFVEYFEYE